MRNGRHTFNQMSNPLNEIFHSINEKFQYVQETKVTELTIVHVINYNWTQEMDENIDFSFK